MGLEKKLSLLRKQHGLSQQELGEKLHVSRQSISKWELGVAEPSKENLVSIGKLFDVPISDLLDSDVQLERKPVMTCAACVLEKPEGHEDKERAPGRAKWIGITLCVFALLVASFFGIRAMLPGEEADIIPMETLPEDVVDLTQTDSFQEEPVQP